MNKKDKKLLVLVLSIFDYCGSGYWISRALRDAGFESYLIKQKKHKETQADYVVEENIKIKYTDEHNIIHIKYDKPAIEDLISRADFILFKGDDPPKKYSEFSSLLHEKPTGIITGGSGFRRGNGKVPEVNRGKNTDIRLYSQIDLKAAITPELCYPGLFNGEYIPAATHDATVTENDYVKDKRWKKKIIIAHSPSCRKKKGTKQFLLACSYLKKLGYDFELDLIEKVSQAESIERKRNATIFFDQCVTGYYGNAALEAMRVGIPTAAWISEDAYNWSGGIATKETCPVINSGSSAYSIAKSLEPYLQDPGKLYRLSQKTYRYIHEVHSLKAVGKRLKDKIERIIFEKQHPWKILLKNSKWKNRFSPGDELVVNKDISAEEALKLCEWNKAEIVNDYVY